MSLIEQKIVLFESEKQSWDTLHSKLDALLQEFSSKPTDEDYQGHRFAVTATITGELGNWEVSIADIDYPIDATNRWGQELTLPIGIRLDIGDDGRPFEKSISDDEKLLIVCSPRGVIDMSCREHLKLEEVEALINDPHIFKVKD